MPGASVWRVRQCVASVCASGRCLLFYCTQMPTVLQYPGRHGGKSVCRWARARVRGRGVWPRPPRLWWMGVVGPRGRGVCVVRGLRRERVRSRARARVCQHLFSFACPNVAVVKACSCGWRARRLASRGWCGAAALARAAVGREAVGGLEPFAGLSGRRRVVHRPVYAVQSGRPVGVAGVRARMGAPSQEACLQRNVRSARLRRRARGFGGRRLILMKRGTRSND